MKEYTNCIICKEKIVNTNEDMITHFENEHIDLVPAGEPIGEFIYRYKHNGEGKKCIICKKPTKWNDKTNKFDAFCSEECKNEYVRIAKERMKNKYGKEHLLDDYKHQQKMLANRHISGKYMFRDGGVVTFTGSYEEDFCKMMDILMQHHSSDIIMPSPHVYKYEYDNSEHFYFPDVFIPSLMLEIEIKDGGDNPNMHHKIQDVDKEKEIKKDEVMKNQKDFHYIKIVNKNYTQFFQLLEKLSKEELTDREKLDKIKVIP